MRRLPTLGASQTGWATTVWVDPGGTTGWAVMSVNPVDLVGPKPIHRIIQHWVCGDIKHNEDVMASEMLQLYDMWEDAAAGIERFDLRQLAVDLSPVSVTAKIKYGLWLAEKWKAEEDDRQQGPPRYLFTQTPSLAKTTLTDDKQREFKLWEPGPDHKRDGVKHCYTFLSRARENPKMRYTAWPNLFKQDGSPLRKRPPTSKRSMR